MQFATISQVPPAQRGNWPFSTEPPHVMGQLQFDAVLRAVPDRAPAKVHGRLLDTPDQTATHVITSMRRVAEAGAIMQDGIDSRPDAYMQAVHGAADAAGVASTGLHAWLRSDDSKVRVIERFDRATRSLADVGTRWTLDETLRATLSDRDLAGLVLAADRAGQAVLELLATPSAVRARPQL